MSDDDKDNDFFPEDFLRQLMGGDDPTKLFGGKDDDDKDDKEDKHDYPTDRILEDEESENEDDEHTEEDHDPFDDDSDSDDDNNDDNSDDDDDSNDDDDDSNDDDDEQHADEDNIEAEDEAEDTPPLAEQDDLASDDTKTENKLADHIDDHDTVAAPVVTPRTTESPTASVADAATIDLQFRLAEQQIRLDQLAQLEPGFSFDLALDLSAPVTLEANGTPIAHCELVEINGRLGARIVKLLS